MEANESIEIPLSRKKMYLMLLGCLVFVLAGGWLLIFRPKVYNAFLNTPIVLTIIGIVSILFFGCIAVMILLKLRDTKAGLIINNMGITINNGIASFGEIPWTDIDAINIKNVANQNFLILVVKNPEYYIHKISGFLYKKTAEINYKNYGSPISISASALQISFDELHKLLTTKFAAHRR